MPHRVLSELRTIQPCDEIEREHLAETLQWVESGVNIYRLAKPATPPKHLVAYFPVVDGEHILLVDHKNALLWLPTGGHVEPGESPRDAVARELHEELSLSVTAQDVGLPVMVTVATTVGLTAGHVDVTLWYAVQGDREAPIQFDREEFNDARWFRFSEVPLGRTDPNLQRFLDKLQAQFVA
jgi:8-oxo-dGTP pyrophosphatase MutT (NUDIX family)